MSNLLFGDGRFGDSVFGGNPDVDPIPSSDRFAAYDIQVAWSKNIPGVAVLDLSTLGGSDLLGGDSAYVLQQFGGPYDNLTRRTDNGVRVESVAWTRGRSDDLSEMQALSATITGRDPTGMMNIHNPNSPLNQGVFVNGSLKPMRPVRVTASHAGVTYPILFGFLRTLDYGPSGRTGEFKIEVTDLFALLETPRKDQPNAGAKPVIAYTTTAPGGGLLTTGAAIGMILDSVGWTDPAMRSLATGDTLVFFEAIGDKTALQLIAELVQASLGLFYIDAAGVATFVDRNTRFTRPVKAEYRNVMKAVGSGLSVDSIKSKWSVTRQTRTGPGQYSSGTPQVAEDFANAFDYGERSGDLALPWIPSDAIAAQMAGQLLDATKASVNPIWNLSVDNREVGLLLSMLTVDLNDRVSVSEAETDTQGIFFVEQISGQIDAANHSHKVSYILSDRSAVAGATLDPFVLGTDTIDGTKVLSF